LLTDAGGAVVLVPGLDPCAMERVDMLSRVGDERDVNARARFAVVREDKVCELCAALALPDRRNLKWREDSRIERHAVFTVANADVDVIEDDPRPVPVHAHRQPTLPEKSLTGERMFV
jgi:hypothetical protein